MGVTLKRLHSGAKGSELQGGGKNRIKAPDQVKTT